MIEVEIPGHWEGCNCEMCTEIKKLGIRIIGGQYVSHTFSHPTSPLRPESILLPPRVRNPFGVGVTNWLIKETLYWFRVARDRLSG